MRIKISMLLLVPCFLAVTLEGCSRGKGATLPASIKADLENQIAKMACIPTESFPFTESPSGSGCSDCGKLVDAGLLTAESESESETNKSVTYGLSELGMRAYVPSDSGQTAYGDSHFCFGKVRLTKITRVFGPVKLGNQKNLGIRYIAQLDDPDPYIFDPRAKKLGIPLPYGVLGKPAIYPEQDVTAVISESNPNDFYLDGNLHIGPIGEK